jgi:hypothetical protein
MPSQDLTRESAGARFLNVVVRPQMSDRHRDPHQQWLYTWQRVGPVLEQQRWDRLALASDDELRLQTLGLHDLWQPELPGGRR